MRGNKYTEIYWRKNEGKSMMTEEKNKYTEIRIVRNKYNKIRMIEYNMLNESWEEEIH